MNDEQVSEIIKATKDTGPDQLNRLITLGNNVEGGMQLNPNKHYFYSTWGRVISVEKGHLKILGGVCSRSNQRLRVQLNCIHPDDQSELLIFFAVANLIDKFFNEELYTDPTKVSSYLVTDHLLFILR